MKDWVECWSLAYLFALRRSSPISVFLGRMLEAAGIRRSSTKHFCVRITRYWCSPWRARAVVTLRLLNESVGKLYIEREIIWGWLDTTHSVNHAQWKKGSWPTYVYIYLHFPSFYYLVFSMFLIPHSHFSPSPCGLTVNPFALGEHQHPPPTPTGRSPGTRPDIHARFARCCFHVGH